MEVVSIVLILLLAVVVSGALSRMLPFAVPTPLVQVGLGCLIGLVTHLRVELEPELFLLLFLPPLLFLDGWRIPKSDLRKDLPTIFGLALGLVLLTVLGIGYFTYWLIPTMPLPVAFALAAVVSPTDPIAVSAIAARVPIPKRMMHILEGEALLNDASGLVCLRFAVAAMLTGSFSMASAGLTFLWLAIGGAIIGVVVTLAASRAKAWVSARFGEDSGSQILVSLLIPFGAYILAEHFHCSGILAAVAAGVTMTFAEISRQAMAMTRLRRNSVWDTVQFALNGIVFTLLGEQLPSILSAAGQTVRLTGHENALWLGAYVLAIVAALGLLRFGWVWLSFRLFLKRSDGSSPDSSGVGVRLVGAMSFAGVRGAITLAGVLTIPLTLTDGTPFPARDLAIFLAAGVIVVSLVAASIGLPVLLRGLTIPAAPSYESQEDEARVSAGRAAVRAIERRLADDSGSDPERDTAVGARVIDLYRDRIESHQQSDRQRQRDDDRAERELRLVGLEAERSDIVGHARKGQLHGQVAAKLLAELDVIELRYRR